MPLIDTGLLLSLGRVSPIPNGAFWHGRPGTYFVCVCSGFGSFVRIFLTVTRAIILWHWSGTAVLLKHYFHNSSMQQEANLTQQTMPQLGRLIWSKGIPMVIVQLKLHMDTEMYLCIYEKAIWSGDRIVIKNMPYCSCWKYHGGASMNRQLFTQKTVSWHSPPPTPTPPSPPPPQTANPTPTLSLLLFMLKLVVQVQIWYSQFEVVTYSGIKGNFLSGCSHGLLAYCGLTTNGDIYLNQHRFR